MTEPSVVHATFTLERTFAASPAETFAAWADRDRKAAWFAPDAERYELDLRPGGIERLSARVESTEYEGTVFDWEALYREIVAQRRIVYTGMLSADGIVATLSLTTVEFSSGRAAGSTDLRLVEQAAYLDGREQPEWRERGTGTWLEALARSLGG